MSSPRPVWVLSQVPGGRPAPGLLLEWRSRPDPRGVTQWYGLVAWARKGPQGWTMTQEWVWQIHLQAMEVALPQTPKAPASRS